MGVRLLGRAPIVLLGLGMLLAACGTDGGTTAVEQRQDRAQFVVQCRYSHSAKVDPIAQHGESTSAHLHDFFGNAATAADSGFVSLVEGDSTCDNPADRSGYWAPALLEGGVPVAPSGLTAYYRVAAGTDPSSVQAFPPGLQMVADEVTWSCGPSGPARAEPAHCAAPGSVHLRVGFPSCWDGIAIDSEDHHAHVAHSGDGGCPTGWPVAVPHLTMVIRYPVTGATADLALSSGSWSSAHADFLDAWEPDGLRREIEACLHADRTCDAG